MAVMAMGGIVYGVHYTLQEYLCTFLVAGGVSVFALNKVSAWTGPSFTSNICKIQAFQNHQPN
jgi:hypothetical protein